ncbi:HNH endonuclease [Paenirhodobacter populi]|uniref:HNH endonuclease n=1 Tax=Paenirhodobacter populi TaxID=2306993 RepID=UPI000FE3AF9B|nr:hypothetical protein D2T32_05625 [Sinirhodobacter populi]
MATKPLPSPEVLGQLLRYDPDTGKLFWKERGPEWFRNHSKRSPEHACANWNARYAGANAGTISTSGHRQIRLGGQWVLAHRAAYAIMCGHYPEASIDHINLDPDDNRWVNLRLATPTQNAANTAKRTGCSSTYKGVTWAKNEGKWVASIHKNGSRISLGYYDDERLAAAAYNGAARVLFGGFMRGNHIP